MRSKGSRNLSKQLYLFSRPNTVLPILRQLRTRDLLESTSKPIVSGSVYVVGGGDYLLWVGTTKRSFALPNDLPTSDLKVLVSEVPTLDMALLEHIELLVVLAAIV